MSRNVPFARAVAAPETIEAVTRVLGSGWLTTGPECAAFEQEFAAWVGAQHAVSVSSCTAALELSLRALRLPPGSRVLVPDITFCGAVETVVHAGHVPVIADVDPTTGQVSPETCWAAARDCGGVAAMMALHYAGYPAPVEELAAAAGVRLSRVVEDAAHALGAWHGDRQIGSHSRAACFSFYATKNLPIGEGGMVTTDDPELAERVRRVRLHAMSSDAWRRYLPGGSWRYTVEEAGLKANLSDLQAAIGRAQLHHLDGWQRRRRELATRYTRVLSGFTGIEVPSSPAGGTHAWHLYPVRIKPEFGTSRDQLVDELARRNIGTSVHFIPLHRMPRFRQVAALPNGGLPGAEAVFEELLSLPLHQGLTDDDVDTVCAAIAEVRARVHPLEVRR